MVHEYNLALAGSWNLGTQKVKVLFLRFIGKTNPSVSICSTSHNPIAHSAARNILPCCDCSLSRDAYPFLESQSISRHNADSTAYCLSSYVRLYSLPPTTPPHSPCPDSNYIIEHCRMNGAQARKSQAGPRVTTECGDSCPFYNQWLMR